MSVYKRKVILDLMKNLNKQGNAKRSRPKFEREVSRYSEWLAYSVTHQKVHFFFNSQAVLWFVYLSMYFFLISFWDFFEMICFSSAHSVFLSKHVLYMVIKIFRHTSSITKGIF